MACFGGSSKVLKKGLNALEDKMGTSSIIYIFCKPNCGAKRTWSIKLRMSSTELFDAASNSNTFNDCPLLKEVQLSHLSQASVSAVKLKQLMVLAKIRAQVVLPTPR